MKKIFCDKNRKTYHGVDAEKLFSEKNDNKFFSDGGVIKVDLERWSEAQFYERKTWMEDFLSHNDDRNFDHSSRFDNYEILNEISQDIHSILEIGCGPFTNIRTFYKKIPNLEKITLVDPLIDQYVNHPNCFYKNKKIDQYPTFLLSIPFESFETEDKFDLIIMNNVLEHCFDVKIIFEKIKKILKRDGILIFSDVFYTPKTIKDGMNFYDAGHPIRLPEEIMNIFLSEFEVKFDRNFEKLYNQEWRNDKYFIGTKK